MDNLRCQAIIDADADIGGYGVMTSFIVTAWMTMFFAGFSAREHLSTLWHQKPWRLHSYFMRYGVDANRAFAERAHYPEPEGTGLLGNNKEIIALLGRLVDLQSATGIGITVAGFSQISSITYYHGQLVNGYWWLTMQSFWVVPLDYADLGVNGAGPIVRLIAILLSTVMGLTFQIYVFTKETVWGDWDWVDGPCYRWFYSTWGWMGVMWVGLSGLYAIALVLIIIPPTRRWVLAYDKRNRYRKIRLNLWFCRNYANLANGMVDTGVGQAPLLARVLSIAKHAILVIVSGTAVVVFWLFVQLLALLLVFGEGFYPLLFAVCVLFNIWNTLDIISLRIMNNALLEDDERRMGFGQVLPLTLVLSVFLPSVHASAPR